MQPIILLLVVLVLFACAYSYMTYRANTQRRTQEKKRNQFHDRV